MRSSRGFDAFDGRTAAAIWRAGSRPRKKRLTPHDSYPRYVSSRPRRGASGGVRKRGGIGARSGPARVGDIAAVASAGEQRVAVDAAPSPPSQGGASGSPARNTGRRPAFWRRPRPSRLKTGSVRTHLRRRSPRGQSLKGRLAPKREARDQRRRAGGLVRLGLVERDPSFPIPPRAHARRARARAKASRTPSGFARRFADHPLGPLRPRG